LLRTAHAHRALGEDDETTQALSEVEQLGCDETAHALVVRVATVAASENGSGLRRGDDGVLRPASCLEPTAEEEEEEEGWRPEE